MSSRSSAHLIRRVRLSIPLAARLLVALLFLLPLIWIVTTALYWPGAPLPTSLRLLPSQPTLQNFIRIWDIVPLGRYTANSLLVTALGVPLTLLTASWAGLGMAGLPRQSQRRWVFLSLAVLMIPTIALWSPRFLVYRALGWYDTVWVTIIPVARFLLAQPIFRERDGS